MPSQLRLFFCRGIKLPNESPGYHTKQSDGEFSIILWEMQSTPSLPSLSGPLWPRVVAPDKVLSMGQIKLNGTFSKRNCLKKDGFNI